MKQFKLLLTFAFMGLNGLAQDNPPLIQKKRFQNDQKSFLMPQFKLNSPEGRGIKAKLDTHINEKSRGRFSHSGSRGDVFLMPTDQMPCLVPDRNSNVVLPNTMSPSTPLPYMPNAVPRVQRLPETDSRPNPKDRR